MRFRFLRAATFRRRAASEIKMAINKTLLYKFGGMSTPFRLEQGARRIFAGREIYERRSGFLAAKRI